MKKYKFRKSDKKYPILFDKEKKKLLNFLPKSIKIEHIGSTSVSNLGGKGIIDILIAVPKNNIEKTKKKLLNRKYRIMPNAGDKNRISFKKFYGILKNKRVHVHLTTIDSKTWKETRKFREKLKKSSVLRKKYEGIKKQGIIKAKGQGKIYRDVKRGFIDKHSK